MSHKLIGNQMKFRALWNGLSVSKFVSLQLRLRKNYRKHFSVYLLGDVNQNSSSTGNSLYNFTKLLKGSSSKPVHLSGGYGFIVASTSQQCLLVSGVNTSSQLGLPSTEVSSLHMFKEIELPFKHTDSKILHISCGRCHTVVSTSEGLFVAGSNDLGQCGLGDSKETQYFTNLPWSNQIPIKQVVCGLDHSLLLKDDGSVWSCGWGADGQTGLGHTQEQRTFVEIKKLKGVPIKQLASKADSTLVLSNCGEVFSWGNSEYSQLGFPTEDTLISTPTKLGTLQNIVDIAIGGSVGLALTAEGEVFSWGYGLLGSSPDPSFSARPQKVTSCCDERVVKIACGLDFYAMLTDEGKLYIWGRLDGVTESRLPEQVDIPSKVIHMSSGIDSMWVFTEDR